MKNPLLQLLTNAVNTYLMLDPESKMRILKLEGKAIQIVLHPFDFTFYCLIKQEKFTLSTHHLTKVDTIIRGTPLQLLGVMATKERHRFFADDVVIEGNAEVGQQIIELFDELKIDWEDYLAKWVGEIPAHHTGRFIRGVHSFLTRANTTLTQNMNEYLHEEAAIFPAKEALDDFFADIDTLRMDADRLDARISQLKLRIKDETPK